eukprot:TRINITY_DN4731_c1_g1_i1.p1 TRINITY_DN4731_c1_g1~~TRINITY_DN4731_c1_g1_i1.p1  ORF type:complete len:225 (+),score=97.10 TRINITY_DN4731_c1_g1_i1:1100-1774(+)
MGCMLHQEQFFAAAAARFREALALLAPLLQRSVAVAAQRESGEGEADESGDVAAAAAAAAQEVAVGCHLNIAAGALLRQRDWSVAVEHCTQALALRPRCVEALVRRAAAWEELCAYARALDDLSTAEAVLLQPAPPLPPPPPRSAAAAHDATAHACCAHGGTGGGAVAGGNSSSSAQRSCASAGCAPCADGCHDHSAGHLAGGVRMVARVIAQQRRSWPMCARV